MNTTPYLCKQVLAGTAHENGLLTNEAGGTVLNFDQIEIEKKGKVYRASFFLDGKELVTMRIPHSNSKGPLNLVGFSGQMSVRFS